MDISLARFIIWFTNSDLCQKHFIDHLFERNMLDPKRNMLAFNTLVRNYSITFELCNINIWILRNAHRARRKLLATTFSRKSQLMKRSMTSSYNKSHSQAACLIYREASWYSWYGPIDGAIVAIVMCHPGVYVLGASFCLVVLLPFLPERKKAWLSSCWPCLELHYSTKSRCDLELL